MVLQIEIFDPATAAGVTEGVLGIEYFPKPECFDRDLLNPPFEPLTGAKFFPVRLGADLPLKPKM